MKKKVLALILALTMVTACLAGCGGSADNNAAEKTETAENAEAAEDAGDTAKEEAAPETAEDPKYGGVLKFGMGDYPKTVGYTPMITANGHLSYLNVAYESLLFYDATGNFIPRLAESWETNADEPSVTWKLRQGVKFSDGTDFNAEAVKINIEEYQKNSRTEVASVSSMEIIDDYTIKMNLSAWDSSLVESIGFYVYYMSPTVLANDPDSLNEKTCGTGAFVLDSFDVGVQYSYVKNENYWQEGLPYLDGVEIRPVGEMQTLSSAFMNGEYDMAHINSYAVINEMINQNDGRWDVIANTSGVGLVLTGFIPNSAEEGSPFADVRVRRALCHAIDAKLISDTCTYGIAPTTDQWAVPGSKTYYEGLNTFEYNPEKAKQLLAEAGYPDGFETTVTCVSANQEAFTACAGMLEAVGIRCKIDLVDSAEQTKRYADGTWTGLMGHFASCGPDLGLYMGRHLALDGAYYAKGILHPEEAMELREKIKTAKT